VDVAAPDWIRGRESRSREFPWGSLLSSVPGSAAGLPVSIPPNRAIELCRTNSSPKPSRRRIWPGPVLLLEECRRRFTKLVTAYQGLWRDRPEKRLQVLTLLQGEFAIHCRVESGSLYPLVVKHADPSVSKRIEEAELEHRVIEAMLQELSLTAPTHGWFDMLMKTLAIRFQRHGDQLDIHLFPLARTLPVVSCLDSGPEATRRRGGCGAEERTWQPPEWDARSENP